MSSSKITTAFTAGCAFLCHCTCFVPTFAGILLASVEDKDISPEPSGTNVKPPGKPRSDPTIEAVTSWFVLLNKCCQVQLAVDASSLGSGKTLVQVGRLETENVVEGH
ncbi:MAG: hypothetical protein M1818_002218 [Claussenomyces sp. TS43310]|nr:MAG: hypothetical protein M1818_002218 [Claussenomyces sp. TS43310]